MERIRADVERELGAMGDGGGGAMPRVLEVWVEVVGSTVARNAWPARISRDGTLHVATDSAAWAFELQHLEREITARLAAAVGGGAPNRLKFAVGQIPELRPTSEGRTAAPAPSAEQRELAEALAAPVEDDALRALVATAVAQSLARAASDRAF